MTFAPSPVPLQATEPALPGQDTASEIALKRERLHALLEERNFEAILLRRNENLAWITAGSIDRRVLLPSELGVVTLLLRRSGESVFLAPNNEEARLRDEDFAGLGYNAEISPWYASASPREIARLAGTERVASDTLWPGTTLVDLSALRVPLAEAEVERYRWLGNQTAEAVRLVLEGFAPGISEREMNARVAYEVWRRGIEPSVLLMAADERIRRYRHANTHNGVLKRFGMINLCTRRWGLVISITRFVHFGPMPSELADKFAAAAAVNAQLLRATRPGATSAQLYRVAADAYTAAGFPGNETKHHQGGPTGYLEREWFATPNGSETVADTQAFAWNPSIQGGKVEDTVLLRNGVIENLTPTPRLPTIGTRVDGETYASAGVLMRS